MGWITFENYKILFFQSIQHPVKFHQNCTKITLLSASEKLFFQQMTENKRFTDQKVTDNGLMARNHCAGLLCEPRSRYGGTL